MVRENGSYMKVLLIGMTVRGRERREVQQSSEEAATQACFLKV